MLQYSTFHLSRMINTLWEAVRGWNDILQLCFKDGIVLPFQLSVYGGSLQSGEVNEFPHMPGWTALLKEPLSGHSTHFLVSFPVPVKPLLDPIPTKWRSQFTDSLPEGSVSAPAAKWRSVDLSTSRPFRALLRSFTLPVNLIYSIPF